MKSMDKYLIKLHIRNGGPQRIYRFPNGYGASVVKNDISYGASVGKWEMAIIKFNGEDDDDWDIDYTTPIVDDVIGYLTDDDVTAYLKKIKKLKGER